MFSSFSNLQARLNRHLVQSGENPVSRSALYRVREMYPVVFPQSTKLADSGRMIYDESVALWLYFALKVHARVGSYRLVLAYMRELDQRLSAQGMRFSEAFPTVSAIDTHFTQAEKIYA